MDDWHANMAWTSSHGRMMSLVAIDASDHKKAN